MNAPEQLYINVHRNHMEGTILQQWDKGYMLIQSVELTANKLLLTFEKSAIPQFDKQQKELKAEVLDSSKGVPDSVLDKVFDH